MELRWKILLQRQGTDEKVPVCSVKRPCEWRYACRFRIASCRRSTLQQLVARDQINASDKLDKKAL